MADRDQRTLLVVHEVSRTASRLAQRMGCEYVLDGKWREAISETESQHAGKITARVPA
jgi:hypothetical protein